LSTPTYVPGTLNGKRVLQPTPGSGLPVIRLTRQTALIDTARLAAAINNYLATSPYYLETLDLTEKPALLSPDMAAVVEVVTGRRRVIDYLWSPVARATHEARRER